MEEQGQSLGKIEAERGAGFPQYPMKSWSCEEQGKKAQTLESNIRP